MTYLEELGRKSIHLGSAIFPLAYAWTDRTTMLWVMIPLVVFALALEISRMLSPAVERVVQGVLGPILRKEEKRLFTGATYVAISCLIMIWFFDKPVAVTALLFMSISDALASLVGLRVGGPRFLGKTLAGSGAFLLSAAAIACWQLPHELVAGLIGAVVATVVEALPLRWGSIKIDDNLAIPLAAGGVIELAMRML